MEKNINQIESLKLPKRSDKRRRVYTSERIACSLIARRVNVDGYVADLSYKGLALVLHEGKRTLDLKSGDNVEVIFHKNKKNSFKIQGKISHISSMDIQNQSHQRIGIQFDIQAASKKEDFIAALPASYVPCLSMIRPQAFCYDPFFFNEVILFQVEGFTHDGIELIVSARCKSVLPHQMMTLFIFVPGRGTMEVLIQNDSAFFRSKNDQKIRFFSKFIAPKKELLNAISEYLVSFGAGCSPAALRKKKFDVGSLSHAIEVNHTAIGDDWDEKNTMSSSYLAPTTLLDAQTNKSQKPSHARTFTCKIGPYTVASCSLIFVDQKIERSFFSKLGYSVIEESFIKKPFVELVGFVMAKKEAYLVDFMIPLIQQIIRVAIQSKSFYLILEATAEIKPVLTKIGFKQIASLSKTKINIHLFALSLSEVLNNEKKQLALPVWDKIYKDLFRYLKDI